MAVQKKAAPVTATAGVGKYAATRTTDLPVSVRKTVFTSPFSRQDPELIAALQESHASGASYFQSLAETPDIIRNGETRRPALKDAEQYVRRHAGEAGVGVSVAPHPDGSGVYFTAHDKRVVKTGTERKPRTRKTTA